jgi:uncharacterized membrane protein
MRQSLMAILAIHILTYISIGFDLPIFRQVVVFIYLTFVPGFVLLKLLKLKETRIVDTILFSIGLSLASLMFIGFLINELFLVVGIPKPLSILPLVFSLSGFSLFLSLLGYKRKLFESSSLDKVNITLSKKGTLRFAVILLPILLGVTGALFVSSSSISIPLLYLMVIIVAALLVLSGLSHKFIPPNLYPLVIFAVSLALSFHIVLISKHIVGFDAQLEYQLFNLTINHGYWALLPSNIGLVGALNYNAMLSVTVLPSIYSVLLNLDGEILFKLLYPFVFSLFPVALYRVYEQQTGKASSLLSTMLIIITPLTFYGIGLLSLDRQIVAEFFLVLSILVLFDKMVPVGRRRVLLIFFGAALVVSHYSTTYFFLALLLFTYVMLRFRDKTNRVLNGAMVGLLSLIAFSYYVFTSSPFRTLIDFLSQVLSKFTQDMASTAARSPDVLTSHSILTFASAVNWSLLVTVQSMIFVGIAVVLFRSDKVKLDPTFRIVLIMSSVALFLSLAIPNVAPALDFLRFYQLSLLFLAPCFVFGVHAFVEIFANLVRRVNKKSLPRNSHKIGTILVCIVLVGYFLSQSGFVNSVTKASPLSYSMDFNRITQTTDVTYKVSFYSAYIPEQNYFSAMWLSKYAAIKSTVYADTDSHQSVLFGYGSVFTQYPTISNSTIPLMNSFVYLSSLNIGDGVIVDKSSTPSLFNSSEITSILTQSDTIYSNGNGAILYVPSSS